MGTTWCRLPKSEIRSPKQIQEAEKGGIPKSLGPAPFLALGHNANTTEARTSNPTPGRALACARVPGSSA
jgi:hypothetical protein